MPVDQEKAVGGELYQSGDRRPIAARDWRVLQGLARWLARRGVSANAISVAGMGSGVAAGCLLAATAQLEGFVQSLAWLAAALAVQLRLLANLLDGMVAIEGGRASRVGELYNEVPDRVSDAATLIGLGYAAGGEVTLGYLAALLAVLTAYVRAQGKAAGAPQEFCGPMAKQQRMFAVTVIAVYCGLTPVAWQPTWGTMLVVGIPGTGLLLIVLGSAWTVVRRLLRIASSLREISP
jgi:phosphatidylglycerophosphate synthase